MMPLLLVPLDRALDQLVFRRLIVSLVDLIKTSICTVPDFNNLIMSIDPETPRFVLISK